jgi:hypothetical protein
MSGSLHIQRFAQVITNAELLAEPDWVVTDNTDGFKPLPIRFTPTTQEAN